MPYDSQYNWGERLRVVLTNSNPDKGILAVFTSTHKDQQGYVVSTRNYKSGCIYPSDSNALNHWMIELGKWDDIGTSVEWNMESAGWCSSGRNKYEIGNAAGIYSPNIDDSVVNALDISYTFDSVPYVPPNDCCGNIVETPTHRYVVGNPSSSRVCYEIKSEWRDEQNSLIGRLFSHAILMPNEKKEVAIQGGFNYGNSIFRKTGGGVQDFTPISNTLTNTIEDWKIDSC